MNGDERQGRRERSGEMGGTAEESAEESGQGRPEGVMIDLTTHSLRKTRPTFSIPSSPVHLDLRELSASPGPMSAPPNRTVPGSAGVNSCPQCQRDQCGGGKKCGKLTRARVGTDYSGALHEGVRESPIHRSTVAEPDQIGGAVYTSDRGMTRCIRCHKAQCQRGLECDRVARAREQAVALTSVTDEVPPSGQPAHPSMVGYGYLYLIPEDQWAKASAELKRWVKNGDLGQAVRDGEYTWSRRLVCITINTVFVGGRARVAGVVREGALMARSASQAVGRGIILG